ncbi:BQ5605_C004g02954 [Microbotryum silenes-dioicae]|uniref:COP9 signalosome complex subunit 6 n=1 Tax=Microbotryum silenes-dioicae TaxID=796604 RepID=A0A2X0N3C2_9BASI|nr:BQ5605_C004g02954 [Microbotryum silenes-dioicae]
MSQGLRVTLHPLPLLNVSEHLTRVSWQQNDPNVRVVGGLLGTQVGRDLEIINSFEIVCLPSEDKPGHLLVDHEYFVTRRDQFKQVFPTLDVLGWYSVGTEPTEQDIALHRQFLEYNENPLFLQFDRSNVATANSKQLPATIYESIVELGQGDQLAKTVLVPTPYEIETGEAERVAVDHVAKPSDSEAAGANSSLVASLTTQRNAVKMLHDRIRTIVSYLEAVQQGTAPRDDETLRQISALLTRLQPKTTAKADTREGEDKGGEMDLPDDGYEEEFMTEYNDVMLTTYLAAMTKGLYSANDLLDKQLVLLSGSNVNAGEEGGFMGGGARTRGGGPGGDKNSQGPSGRAHPRRGLSSMA